MNSTTPTLNCKCFQVFPTKAGSHQFIYISISPYSARATSTVRLGTSVIMYSAVHSLKRRIFTALWCEKSRALCCVKNTQISATSLTSVVSLCFTKRYKSCLTLTYYVCCRPETSIFSLWLFLSLLTEQLCSRKFFIQVTTYHLSVKP